MTTQNDFPPGNRFPVLLPEDTETFEQPDILRTWDWETISSRVLKVSILGIATAAIAVAILLIDNPVELLTDVTASWGDKPALQSGTEPSTSTTAALPEASRDAATAAAFEPAAQSQAEIAQPSNEGLLKQFRTWATDEDTRAQVEPVQPAPPPAAPAQLGEPDAPAQIAQDTPVRIVQDARAQAEPVKKHRRARSVHNARAEIRPTRNIRTQARQEQDARPPAPDPRAQEQAAQNSQTPWFLQGFGGR